MKRAVAVVAAAFVALVAPADTVAPVRPPAVVGVSVVRATGPADRATGFVAGRDRVVTVAHVLDGGGTVTVSGPDGRRRRAEVLKADRRLDLAVLGVPGLGGRPPSVGGGAPARVVLPPSVGGGPPARVVLPQRSRLATLSRRIDAHLDGARLPALELRAEIAVGDSGAPVVTRGGELVGVVFARSRTRARIAYAVEGAAVPGLLGAPRPLD